MSDEPTLSEVDEHANEPASKRDVQQAIDELARITKRGFDDAEGRDSGTSERITSLESDVATLREDMGSLKQETGGMIRGQQAMLNVLDENNQLLKELRRLPERVDRLERSVFRR